MEGMINMRNMRNIMQEVPSGQAPYHEVMVLSPHDFEDHEDFSGSRVECGESEDHFGGHAVINTSFSYIKESSHP